MMIHDGTILLTHIHFATMINFFSLLYPEKTKNNPSSSYYLIANKRDDKRLFLLYRVTKQLLTFNKILADKLA